MTPTPPTPLSTEDRVRFVNLLEVIEAWHANNSGEFLEAWIYSKQLIDGANRLLSTIDALQARVAEMEEPPYDPTLPDDLLLPTTTVCTKWLKRKMLLLATLQARESSLTEERKIARTAGTHEICAFGPERCENYWAYQWQECERSDCPVNSHQKSEGSK